MMMPGMSNTKSKARAAALRPWCERLLCHATANLLVFFGREPGVRGRILAEKDRIEL
jgi:hypothetical protein